MKEAELKQKIKIHLQLLKIKIHLQLLVDTDISDKEINVTTDDLYNLFRQRSKLYADEQSREVAKAQRIADRNHFVYMFGMDGMADHILDTKLVTESNQEGE